MQNSHPKREPEQKSQSKLVLTEACSCVVCCRAGPERPVGGRERAVHAHQRMEQNTGGLETKLSPGWRWLLHLAHVSVQDFLKKKRKEKKNIEKNCKKRCFSCSHQTLPWVKTNRDNLQA